MEMSRTALGSLKQLAIIHRRRRSVCKSAQLCKVSTLAIHPSILALSRGTTTFEPECGLTLVLNNWFHGRISGTARCTVCACDRPTDQPSVCVRLKVYACDVSKEMTLTTAGFPFWLVWLPACSSSFCC